MPADHSPTALPATVSTCFTRKTPRGRPPPCRPPQRLQQQQFCPSKPSHSSPVVRTQQAFHQPSTYTMHCRHPGPLRLCRSPEHTWRLQHCRSTQSPCLQAAPTASPSLLVSTFSMRPLERGALPPCLCLAPTLLRLLSRSLAPFSSRAASTAAGPVPRSTFTTPWRTLGQQRFSPNLDSSSLLRPSSGWMGQECSRGLSCGAGASLSRSSTLTLST